DGRPGRKPVPARRVLDAVLWILNTGAQWHMLPQCYPNHKTVHRRFQHVFVERLWKTIKYEEVYLHAYDTVSAAKESLTRYVSFYNGRRPHAALDRQTPDAAYFNRLPLAAAA